MNSEKIRIEVPTRDQVVPASQVVFDAMKDGFGFVPNLYATMGLSSTALAKYVQFQNAKSSLSNKEKEVINLIVSQINGCRYCQSAHTVIGKMNGFSEEEILRIRSGNASDPKLNSLVQITKSITENRGRVDDVVLEAFYAAGYSQEQLIDVIVQVGDKIISNYLHNLTQVPIDFPLAPEL